MTTGPRVRALVEHDDDRVVAAAGSLARLLGVGTDEVAVPPGDLGARVDCVLGDLAADGVVAAALGAGGPGSVCWEVITRAKVPVLVVPRLGRRTPERITSILLPLDGSEAAALGVAEIARLAVDAGVRVEAMHCFDEATVPAFWDQAAHTSEHWSEEFLRRYLPEPVHLDLRRGRSADEVPAATEAGQVDLVVIAWGQDLAAGRARTVRSALTDGSVPVLLVATGR